MVRNYDLKRVMFKIWVVAIFGLVLSMILPPASYADGISSEKMYRQLLRIAKGTGDISLFENLNAEFRKIDWNRATEMEFAGNLRHLRVEKDEGTDGKRDLYLVRKLSGEIFILALPEDTAMLKEGADSYYSGLEKMLENKMVFKIKATDIAINGEVYKFAQFMAKPYQVFLDKIFKISIILMLFFVMVGMGLTLTFKDFTLVFTKPRGIILGEILQFGFMPLMALGIGHLLGFYEHYPFIFVGMILITAIPGGVTSNLMTHYAKGDLALSISLTSFSSILSLIFTPLLLALYCANVPEVTVPVKIIVQTILILVLIPLVIGMLVRGKWEKFAKKATPFFSALGVIALLFIMIAGVLGNLDKFADTDRYGVMFYSMVFSLTMLGMIFGIIFPKLIGVNNYQTRAISMETGIRNAALAMTIAILIQDHMGDFYSSMFVTSGIFGLAMYIAGAISIVLYKNLLPLEGHALK
ncbi:MAG: bile acid:sodium symporter [Syntrophobacterales bacterium]|nr:bile acid:sodium symporter [Syntrophobacterales bacterium]